jgi:hypothetical protein
MRSLKRAWNKFVWAVRAFTDFDERLTAKLPGFLANGLGLAVALSALTLLFAIALEALRPPLTAVYRVFVTPGTQAPVPVRAALTGTLFALSVALTTIRYNYRTLYGAAELAFALVFTWNTLTRFGAEAVTNVVSLIGAVYLMVRGWINIVDGIQEYRKAMGLPPPPFARWRDAWRMRQHT